MHDAHNVSPTVTFLQELPSYQSMLRRRISTGTHDHRSLARSTSEESRSLIEKIGGREPAKPLREYALSIAEKRQLRLGHFFPPFLCYEGTVLCVHFSLKMSMKPWPVQNTFELGLLFSAPRNWNGLILSAVIIFATWDSFCFFSPLGFASEMALCGLVFVGCLRMLFLAKLFSSFSFRAIFS